MKLQGEGANATFACKRVPVCCYFGKRALQTRVHYLSRATFRRASSLQHYAEVLAPHGQKPSSVIVAPFVHVASV